MKSYWTAAATHRGEEQRAAHHIERQGFPYYLPLMYVGTRRCLLFPGYIFPRIKRNDTWKVLQSTRGISKLFLTAGQVPARVGDAEIRALQSMEDDCGVVVLPDSLRGTATRYHRLSKGDTVRVSYSEGAYALANGLVQGMPERGRVDVLLTLLGRMVVKQFDEAVLEII